MTKQIVKKLKGDLSESGLIKRWHILKHERAGRYAPLRIALERHAVEHRLMEMAKAKKVV